MKRILAFILAAVLAAALGGCSSKSKDIEGIITGYVQVEEYTVPLIVIESNEETVYLALNVADPIAYDFDHPDEALLEGILTGEIKDIKVSIDGAERGKTIMIDGEKVIVWQSHQIWRNE